MDHNRVHWVRCSLLGLETGALPSKKDIDTSEHFIPQAAASESEPPEVIMDHWLPILWKQGLLAECHPDQFTAAGTLAQTLMAEFVRQQLIVGEDFTKSLIALRTDLEASCEALVSDIARTMDLHPDDPVSCQVKAALHKFQQTTSLKVTLPLMELEAAREDMDEFMQSHLQEINSQTESQELIGELSQKLADHTSRVQELVQVLELAEGEVSL